MTDDFKVSILADLSDADAVSIEKLLHQLSTTARFNADRVRQMRGLTSTGTVVGANG